MYELHFRAADTSTLYKMLLAVYFLVYIEIVEMQLF